MDESRRRFLSLLSGLGLGGTVFPGALLAEAKGGKVTKEQIARAEELAGLHFDDTQREMMSELLDDSLEQLAKLREVTLENRVAPALVFDALPPGAQLPKARPRRALARRPAPSLPGSKEEIAFLPAARLGELVRAGKISSVELTRLYLERLESADKRLACVVTLTDERALRQAKAADEEIARGKWRGPLHGVPWGAKDLLAVKGHPTTWGAGGYQRQIIDEDATVVRRLDQAGAVLIAKLTLGELAMGDHWFGGVTKNPWNFEEGSSGSSAGPAAATAAGLVGFSIGSETLGSISSPSTRCGATGLRPTFGRIPRTGAMALSFSMDKLGPICRTAEDCALVFDAVKGPDGRDASVREAPFSFDPQLDPRSLSVGYLRKAFEESVLAAQGEKPAQHEWKDFDDAALAVLEQMGIKLHPVELPDIPWQSLRPILVAEAAATFDELTRSGRDRELVQQGKDNWPNIFRAARFITAVDYLNANRVRAVAIARWQEMMKGLDVLVAPTRGSGQLLASNLTGAPAVIVPNGFQERESRIEDAGPSSLKHRVPVSLTFIGAHFGEDRLLAMAHAYQKVTRFHLEHPSLQ
ncbi:MAG: amidase [Deltaproteobacteria bacterium]|nr:MAG: amidase [Deltaproteobacteria bacterium]